eukprot:TRINITY_DN10733_c0_g2_i1.p1 TRINITY_DN10733_c0_g2~~TRINITY_DN10733_c0_g2_i1.p1  ORF type:complete len:328 (-),score=49.22 TRINITY_DN10733_c0_g2_i1:574-1455(-)
MVRVALPELTAGVIALGRSANVVVRFAVGKPPLDLGPAAAAELERALAGEQEMHGDLARLPHPDGHKATHSSGQKNGKVWHLLAWALRNFPQADLYFKQDDDTIVDWRVTLPLLLEHLPSAGASDGVSGASLPPSRLYVGRLCPKALCCGGGRRCRLPAWAHCAAGHLYGLSGDIVRWIVEHARPTAGNEDLTVCGWVHDFTEEVGGGLSSGNHRARGLLDPRGLLYPPSHDDAWIHGVKTEAQYSQCLGDRLQGCAVADAFSVLGELQRFRLRAPSDWRSANAEVADAGRTA